MNVSILIFGFFAGLIFLPILLLIILRLCTRIPSARIYIFRQGHRDN